MRGNYNSLLFNEETGSMEMVVTVVGDGGKVWINLDVEQSLKVKRKCAEEK
jgi:hypothetical protein